MARCRGLLAECDAHRSALEDSIGGFSALAMPFEAARSELALGERLRRHGARREAREHLSLALGTFERLGAVPWSERARRELGATGASMRARDSTRGDELTPRELQIALQVAREKDEQGRRRRVVHQPEDGRIAPLARVSQARPDLLGRADSQLRDGRARRRGALGHLHSHTLGRPMVTSEEIADVPLFASLTAADRERLSRACADVRLAAGEYAVHEGEERALFVVLEGHIDVVKVVDGIERVLGERVPGAIFGEVPITLGTSFPSGFRAAEPSRVMHVDVTQYYAIAAAAPDVALQVGALARERIGGLQGVAAEPPKPRAHLVGHRWDAACSDLRRFLDRNQITFEWITPDASDAAADWGGELPPDGDLPALRAGGQTLVRPALREVAELLGLQTRATAEEYDAVIVGAGPAGLAAAVYGASEGLRTIVIEQEAPGGQAGSSSRIENYLGFPAGVSGDELSKRALQQARRLGAEILVTRTITGLDPGARAVQLDGGDELRGRTIILATGVTWRHLAIPGIEPLVGKGIYYGAARSEAPGTHGLAVHIIGAGNSAGQAALFFSNHAPR